MVIILIKMSDIMIHLPVSGESYCSLKAVWTQHAQGVAILFLTQIY